MMTRLVKNEVFKDFFYALIDVDLSHEQK